MARQHRLARTQAADAGYGVICSPKKLNDLNPYSFDADGWCEPTKARVKAYDRPGPPVDARAGRDLGERRSVLAGHIRALKDQPRRAAAWETLWDRWRKHPRKEVVQHLFPALLDAQRKPKLYAEVAAFRVRTTRDERPTSLSECLLASGLSTGNADMILALLVEMRHAWTSRATDAVDAGYDDVNWRHACGELAQVLDIAADAGLGDDASCDAALVRCCRTARNSAATSSRTTSTAAWRRSHCCRG